MVFNFCTVRFGPYCGHSDAVEKKQDKNFESINITSASVQGLEKIGKVMGREHSAEVLKIFQRLSGEHPGKVKFFPKR